MKTMSKKWMQRMALAAMGLIVASAAQAITFDEAVSLLPAKDLAALREAPSAVVESLSDISQVASEWKAGRLAAKDAAVPAADAVARLTVSWSGLAMASAETRWITHQVAVVVLATDVKKLMVAAEWKVDGPLAEAVVGWLDESMRVRPLDAPKNPCFGNLAGCFDHCSDLESWVARSFCGLDCGIDFIGCVGPPLGGALGGVLDAGRGGPADPN